MYSYSAVNNGWSEVPVQEHGRARKSRQRSRRCDATALAREGSFITRRVRLANTKFEGTSSLHRSTDARFSSQDRTTHRTEGIPNAVGDGIWSAAEAEPLIDLGLYGFNMLCWASGQRLDYTNVNLQATRRFLDNQRLVPAGSVSNFRKAKEPRYFDTAAGYVGLVAVASPFHESWIAGAQSPYMVGRPEGNASRHNIEPANHSERLQHLRQIATSFGICPEHDLSVELVQKRRTEEHFYLLITPSARENQHDAEPR